MTTALEGTPMSEATDMYDDLWDDMRPELFSEEWTAAELEREREEEANPPTQREIAIEEGWDTGTTDAAWEADRRDDEAREAQDRAENQRTIAEIEERQDRTNDGQTVGQTWMERDDR